MENGSPANRLEPLDEFHHQIVAETAPESSAPEIPAIPETDGDLVELPRIGARVDPNFTQKIISDCCQWHSESVREEFLADLRPVAGEAQAQRIADRAAMSPVLQNAVATHGANVLRKHGAEKYVNDEAVLVTALAMYWRGLSAARKERDVLLKKFQSANGVPRDSATAVPDFSAHETKQAENGSESLPVVSLENLKSSAVRE